MPHQTALPDALADFGCRVQVQPGALTRGSASFFPSVVVVHHTASGTAGGNTPSLRICTNGRPDLPGPLCQVLLARDGLCVVVACGRANHAGAGSWAGAVGNSMAWGIEAENNGVGEPWGAAQIDAYHRAAAAMCSLSGVGAANVCGHKEWCSPPGRKIDPTGINMTEFRKSVGARLAAGDGPDTAALLAAIQRDEEDADMATQVWYEKGKPGRAALVTCDGSGIAAQQVRNVNEVSTKRFLGVRVGGYDRLEVSAEQFDAMRAQAIGSGGFLGLDGKPKK